MMALKRLNHEFNSISNSAASYSIEDEAHLHCLLKDTIMNSKPDDFINGIQDLPLALHNLHQVVVKCDPKSGPYGQAVKLIENIILSLKDKQNVLQSMPFLMVLTDILLQSRDIEYILRLIQDVSFGISIKICQEYLERLIKFCIEILCNESVEHEVKMKIITLSVLINLCSKNPISLNLLEHQINPIDLQKKIPLETYGVLTCKMSLVLNECGHILRDSDVRNFLKYTVKELHRIPSLDEKTLKHMIEFIRDISERPTTKLILQQYDFSLGIRSAMMTLETVDSQTAIHTTSLFEIIKIVLAAKNTTLNGLIITIIDFAIKRLRSPDCCIQALEILTSIFSNDAKISPNNFDLEQMQEILGAILFSTDRKSDILAPLFKLLNALSTHYKLNLIKNQVVESVFAPLLKVQRPKYFKIPIGDITMYLEFLALLSTLCENHIFETKPNIFHETNVQFLIAMSIKHGNKDQCCLALSLMKRFTIQHISEMISANNDDLHDMSDPHLFMQNNHAYAMRNLNKDIGSERVKNVFLNIEKASLNEKVDIPASDFIDLYTLENATLKQEIEMLTRKYEDASKAVDIAKGQQLQLKVTSMKWSELAQNLQRSNETLIAENEKLNAIVTSLRSKYKSVMHESDDALKKLALEKTVAVKKNKEMEEKVQTLEDELKDTEDMRQTILSLMSKRKKPSKD